MGVRHWSTLHKLEDGKLCYFDSQVFVRGSVPATVRLQIGRAQADEPMELDPLIPRVAVICQHPSGETRYSHEAAVNLRDPRPV